LFIFVYLFVYLFVYSFIYLFVRLFVCLFVYLFVYLFIYLFIYMKFQVLTEASMKITVFWDIAPCNLVIVDRRFRGAYCLHHHRPNDEGSTHL
jgi:hypothetical protein